MALTYEQKQQLLKDLLSDQSLEENQAPAEGMLASLLQPEPTFQQSPTQRNIEQFAREDARAAERAYNPQQFQSPQEPAPAPLPQNYIRNDRTGAVTDLGPSQTAPQGPQANMARPVEYMGQKGFWSDDGRIILNNGKIVSIQDEGTNARDLTRRKVEAEIRKLEAETRKADRPEVSDIDRFTAREEAKTAAAAERAKRPGTAEYARVQKDVGIAQKAETQRQGALASTNALDKAVADIFQVDPKDLPAVMADKDRMAKRLAPAAGWLDARTFDWLPLTWDSPATKQDLVSSVGRLQKLAQMGGLEGLRAAGVAPGSITEKEWPIFQAKLANLDLTQSEKALAAQLQDVFNTTANLRGKLQGAAPEGTVPAVQSGAERQAALIQEAQQAIAKGADPAKVNAQLQQLLAGD